MQESIQIKKTDDITVIKILENKLYQNAVTPFKEKMIDLLDQGNKKIIIDLSDVDVMNSSGLGILITAVTILKDNNGALRLINVSDRINNLLKITKLTTVFEIAESYDQAIKSLRS